MARAIKRLWCLGTGKIYYTVKAGSIRRPLCPQQSPRCVSVLLISDESCSISSELEEMIREKIEKKADALKEKLEQLLSERLEPCVDNWCDGHKKHGRWAAGRIHHISNRKLAPLSGTRLLYYLSRNLKNRLFGQINAQWYREGPPNNDLSCHTAA